MAAAVREAMAQLRKEEKDADRLERIEKAVTEKVTESAPRQTRRLTRLIWGDDE